MDAIAARARASKRTLYRRWNSKAALVVDAIRELSGLLIAPADTGDLRADLVDFLLVVADSLTKEADLAIALLSPARRDSDLMEALHEKIRLPRQELSRIPIERAIARGELPSGADTLCLDRVASPILLHRAIWNDGPLDRAFVEHLVDEIVLPTLMTHSIESRAPKSRTSGRNASIRLAPG